MIKDKINEFEKAFLSPYATLSSESKGRLQPISEDLLRSEFQRDRDRIIHCKSFRRLMNKTQVFISPEPDHYRTRMTHTIEVMQIGRTIARGLRLNEDLIEAAAFGHDLGHPPFAHAGERALQRCYDESFSHAKQSLRVVDKLERNGQGLNLTFEVRDAIVNHSGKDEASTLEGKILKLADQIAYINHDIDDSVRAGIITEESIPKHLTETLGDTHSKRIETLISNVIDNSQGKNEIKMSADTYDNMMELRQFLFDNVYKNPKAKGEEGKVEEMIIILYDYFLNHLEELPSENVGNLNDPPETRVCDYISGMTDRFAISVFNRIYIPKAWNIY